MIRRRSHDKRAYLPWHDVGQGDMTPSQCRVRGVEHRRRCSDIANNYYLPLVRPLQYDISAYVDFLGLPIS
ncbi:hypothetical protein EJB05_43720, partial [Eragrostis curvula]